jgi:hypothetical protein
VFSDENGEPLANPGFDAIVGNPPWDMVRGDSGDSPTRASRRDEAKCLTAFVRESGIYRVDARSHVNRYQLFVERALQLARRGGRIGFILPAGTVTDGGCAPLRRHLFDHASVDAVVGFDNRHRIFPIHRSVRFLVLTATNGAPTSEVRCRFGIDDADTLDRPGVPGEAFNLTRAFISRLSGEDDLAIPEIRGAADLRILEQISARIPTLDAAGGWHVRFGRELNATDDRNLFVPFDRDGHGRPVLEGKQIEPFRVCIDRCQYQLRDGASVRIPRRLRLAYRDIASATNRVTLIAAVVPADAVSRQHARDGRARVTPARSADRPRRLRVSPTLDAGADTDAFAGGRGAATGVRRAAGIGGKALRVVGDGLRARPVDVSPGARIR